MENKRELVTLKIAGEMKETTNKTKALVSKTVRNQLFLIITFLAIPLFIFLIIQPIWHYHQDKKEYRENYLSNVENMLAERINHTISHISVYQTQLSNSLTNQMLQNYVYLAHSIATQVYEVNKASMSEEELQSLVCETLRNIRFTDNRSYFFAADFNGVVHLQTDRPEQEGSNIFNFQDVNGKYVVQDIIEIVQSDAGEGLYTYSWTMPDSASGTYEKTSYVKLFQPFNWYIGTGEYSTSLEQLLREDAVNWINSIQYCENEYLFAIDYNGTTIAHGGDTTKVGRNIRDIQDENDVYFVREIIEVALSGGGICEYSTTKPSTGEQAPKITYAAVFEPWGWIIGTGVYLDDFENAFAVKYSELKSQLWQRAILMLLILVFVLLLAIKRSTSFSNQLQEEFDVFLQHFKRGNKKASPELINKEFLRFQEFQHLADISNETTLNTLSVNNLLQQSNQQLELVLEGSQIGWWDWNITTGREFYNNVLPELLGYSLEEIKPHIDWWQNKIHPDDAKQLRIDLNLHFQGKTKFFTNKHRLKTKTGEWKWFFDHGKVVKWNDSGDPIRMLGTLQDIDKQQKLLIKLQESEELYRLLADNTGDIIWIINLEMTIVYISPAVKNILGYSTEELIGFSSNSLVDEESFQRLLNIGKQRIALGSEIGPVLFHADILHKNGKVIPMEIKGKVLYSEKGEPYAFQGVSRDVTEKSTLEKELQQSQKMEAVGQLAGGIAHDFNNLLQVVNGNAEIALMRLKTNSPAYSAIQEISSAGKKATVLVQQILAFSRRQVLTIETINLNTAINNFTPMLKGLLTENISLVFTPEKNLWLIDADTGQLEQVILNLAINARDAITASGGSILIKTQNTTLGIDFCKTIPNLQPGNYVKFTITDTGAGMDEATKNSCFEPFFTTKEIDKGTGLGLATVYGLIKQHKGYITVDSVLGEGTIFSIYIPVSEKKETKQKKNPTPSIKGGRELILLADDDPGVLNIAKEFLVHAGYSVITATDGEEAIDLFDNYKGKIDLFLLDVMMPKLSGYAVYKSIKNRNPEAKFLFASGYSKKAVHNNFILEDGLSLVQKPYKFAEFLKAVRDILNSK